MKGILTTILITLLSTTFCVAQNKSKSSQSKPQVSQNTPYDLVAIATLNRDTLYFLEHDVVSTQIKEVWDKHAYPNKPVMIYVNDKSLYAQYNRLRKK